MTADAPWAPSRMVVAVAWALAVLCTLALRVLGQSSGFADPPDLLLFAEPAEVLAAMGALGEAGRAAYVRWAWLDVVYPLAYATALGGSVLRLAATHARARSWRPGAWLAVGAAVADLVENACFVAMASRWPDIPGWVVALGAWANTLKWGLVVPALGLGLLAAGILARGR